MTYPKALAVVAAVLFMTIAVMAVLKHKKASSEPSSARVSAGLMPIALERDVRPARLKTASAESPVQRQGRAESARASPVYTSGAAIGHEKGFVQTPAAPAQPLAKQVERPLLPEADRIAELFNKGEPKLPFVETVIYKSSVPWQKGRPAWLADYASYYETSRHFIARSLNGKPDYLRQEVCNGDRFNVFRKEQKIEFYLLVDLSRQKMWFYAIDKGGGERTLLKTYRVGLGRKDESKLSGCLTPVGKFLLGNKVAIYQPKVEGFHKGKRVEMMRVFGSRWIPFERELEKCSEPAKGFGLHGVPWTPGPDGLLREDRSSLSCYDSDGCIRLADADIKELFAIILTKPTTIEVVKDFYDASF